MVRLATFCCVAIGRCFGKPFLYSGVRISLFTVTLGAESDESHLPPCRPFLASFPFILSSVFCVAHLLFCWPLFLFQFGLSFGALRRSSLALSADPLPLARVVFRARTSSTFDSDALRNGSEFSCLLLIWATFWVFCDAAPKSIELFRSPCRHIFRFLSSSSLHGVQCLSSLHLMVIYLPPSRLVCRGSAPNT